MVAGWMQRRAARLVVLTAVSGVFLIAGLVQASRDSAAVDEVSDVAAGVSALTHRDIRMSPEHGLAHQVVPAVLPLLIVDPVVPKGTAWESGDWFEYAEVFADANESAGTWDELLFWFRVVPLLAAVGCGCLIHTLGTRLFGPVEGLLGAVLWFTTPYVLGVGHLSSLDVSAAATTLALALGCLRLIERPAPWRMAEVGLAFAAVLLVRHSGALLGVVVVGAILYGTRTQPWVRRLGAVALVNLISVATVWMVHRGIDPVPVDGVPGDRFEGIVSVARGHGLLERFAVSLPLPLEWRAGIGYLFVLAEDRDAYLFGQYWTGGRVWYLPASAVAKLPLTLVVALVAGVARWVSLEVSHRRPEGAVMGGIVGLTALFLVVQPLNIGFRLAIPLVALSCVGAGLVSRIGRWRVGQLALGVLLVVQVGASVVAHPTSLAWSPVPFDDGYRWVSDGSIDFGQAAHGVIERHEANPLVARTLTEARGAEPLPGVPPVVGAEPDALVGDVAVGASQLTVYEANELSWLRAYCPVELLQGGAILVYRFDQPPDMSPGPDVPKAPCPGGVSRR